MKILIVTYAFYPDISPRSFRATELAKEFARQGHEVTVLTKYREEMEYTGLQCRDKISIRSFGKLKWPEIKVSNNKLLHWPSRIIRRFLNLLFEYPAIEMMFKVKKALMKETGYDLLISIAVPYPIHWGTAWARNSQHQIAKTWVADCGDPYFGRENDSFKVPFYFKYVEKWFCNKVNYLSVPTKGSIKGYLPEFYHKIKVIPQAFRFEDIKFQKDCKKHTVPTFAYAGGLNLNVRDPREFIEYILSKDIDFEFHIYTKEKKLLNDYLNKANGKIKCYNIEPREILLPKLAAMDFLVNIEYANGNTQTPSKLIDYSIIGKPILSVRTGKLDKSLVDNFLNGDYSGKYIVENVEQYRIENVCKKFLELI